MNKSRIRSKINGMQLWAIIWLEEPEGLWLHNLFENELRCIHNHK